jgi:hypothetical protein
VSIVDHTPRALPGERTAVQSALLVCGVLASVVYVAATVAGALRWEGYSTVHQAVSELSAIDTPSRPLMVTLLLVHSVLALAFGVAVLSVAGRNRALRVTAWMLVAIGVVDLVAPLFPMHRRGVAGTWTDTGHIVFTVLNVLPILLAIGFGAVAFRGWVRVYSLVTLAAAILFGALAGTQGAQIAADEPTPWHGIYERIMIGSYLLWMAVLAVTLLRARPPSRSAW